MVKRKSEKSIKNIPKSVKVTTTNQKTEYSTRNPKKIDKITKNRKHSQIILKSAKIVKKIPKSAILVSNEDTSLIYFTENCAYLGFDEDFIRVTHKDFNRLVRHLFRFFQEFDFPLEKSGYVV